MTIDLEGRRAELVAMRARMLGAAHDVVEDAAGDEELSNAVGDQHIADHATETLDHELDASLELNAEELARAIDAALARMAEGTYGVCARCGQPIPEERLDALPYAVLCLPCRALEERE